MMDDEDMGIDEHTGRPRGAREDEARQQAAVEAVRALDDVVAPDSLRRAVADAVAQTPRAHARERRRLRLRLGGALAAAGALAAILLVVVLGVGGDSGGGAVSPRVNDVAHVALAPATAPAPAVQPDGELLEANAGPIAFPSWTRAGWHAVGERTDTIDGRDLRTVRYADAAGREIGYAIADGPLPVTGGQVVDHRGARLRVLAYDGTQVVTWRRDGQTCILAGRGVALGRLLTLASYAA